MAKQERGLGIGLGALLGAEGANTNFRKPVQYINSPSSGRDGASHEGRVVLLDIASIEPNPFQPRVNFDEQALKELAASISNLGLIQPITVRVVEGGKYQIISGERRFRACRMANLKSVPAYVRKADDDASMLEMAIVENVQRENLDPIETAMSYRRLIEECRLTQEEMADKIGKSRVSVTNHLRLLRLPARVQYDLKVGNISVGHAKVLLGVEDNSLQERLCDEVIREGLSVRALEERLKQGKPRSGAKQPVAAETELPDDYYKVAEILGKFFANNVAVKRAPSGKGILTVRFESDEQMRSFLDSLLKCEL